jgi:hypothetical protein
MVRSADDPLWVKWLAGVSMANVSIAELQLLIDTAQQAQVAEAF